MTNPGLRKNLQDLTDLYADIQKGTLLKPAHRSSSQMDILDGHPASSEKWDLFEALHVRKIVEMAIPRSRSSSPRRRS